MTEKPEFYTSDLTDDRLQTISSKLLDVLDEAHSFSESPNATAWFRGTANYGLPQGMLILMHEDDNYPWLTLANQTMDYTARIGKTLVQFVVDDPISPRKSHRLKRNSVERFQISFDLEDHINDVPLIWRFYLNPMSNGVDYSPAISLLGFDSNENAMCHWEYESVITGPVINNIPESIEIDEPVLTVRKRKEQKNQSNE
jgi:hypothetical protein